MCNINRFRVYVRDQAAAAGCPNDWPQMSGSVDKAVVLSGWQGGDAVRVVRR